MKQTDLEISLKFDFRTKGKLWIFIFVNQFQTHVSSIPYSSERIWEAITRKVTKSNLTVVKMWISVDFCTNFIFHRSWPKLSQSLLFNTNVFNFPSPYTFTSNTKFNLFYWQTEKSLKYFPSSQKNFQSFFFLYEK